MYDVEIEHRLQEISKQIEEERTRNFEYTENDRINQLGFNQAKIINDNAIVRQVFDLRTPEYTLVMPSDICAPKYASTGAVTSQQKQVTSNLSNWKQRLSITLALFLLLRFRGMLFATESFIETPTANLVDYADILQATICRMHKYCCSKIRALPYWRSQFTTLREAPANDLYVFGTIKPASTVCVSIFAGWEYVFRCPGKCVGVYVFAKAKANSLLSPNQYESRVSTLLSPKS